MEQLNRMALELVDEAIDFADELAIGVQELDNGGTVLDFGVTANGGIEAGLLLAEIQTGGLASLQTDVQEVAGAPLTHAQLTTDHPAMALLCGQKAGWEVSVDGFEGLGSGPARAIVAQEEIFQRLAYHEEPDFAVLAVESETLPGEAVVEHVSELTGVPTGSVFLPAFSTASLTGSVCTATRAAELATFRLAELGYDPLDVLSVAATAPSAPVAETEDAALGRTNDALAYGAAVHLTVAEPFDEFDAVASSAADEYGTPFADIFETHDWDFYDVPVDVFAPAQVTIDVVGGETHVVGSRDEDLLAESFGLA